MILLVIAQPCNLLRSSCRASLAQTPSGEAISGTHDGIGELSVKLPWRKLGSCVPCPVSEESSVVGLVKVGE